MEGSIIYALISFGEKPLAHYYEYKGTYQKGCQKYLHSIETNSSGAFKMDNYYFIFFINENNITYLIMTDDKYSKASALSFLESIKKEFLSAYADTNFEETEEFGLDKEFKEILKMKYEYYNENEVVIDEPTQKLLDELKNQLLNCYDYYYDCSDLLNERDDIINSIGNRAEELASSSYKYKKSSTKIKNVKKRKIFIIIGTIVATLVILYALISIVCGSWTFHCKS